jgi:phosphomannomutase
LADTRPSGVDLTLIIKIVCAALDTKMVDFHVVTTPQLQHIVRALNVATYGIPTLDGNYSKLASSFNELVASEKLSINIDCANGVGAVALESVLSLIPIVEFILDRADIDDTQVLNQDCGADYVKMIQSAPGISIKDNDMWVSLDGDADGIVFYYSQMSQSYLMDRDKIAKQACLNLTLEIFLTAYANGASTQVS